MIRAIAKRMRTRSMRTAAVPKPRAIIDGSGDLTNSHVARGREIMGPEVGLVLSEAVNPAVSKTGAVSPMPIAVPRMIEVIRPDLAVGKVTRQTVLH
jgi:hypothetical protein